LPYGLPTKPPVILFRTDFRGGYKLGGDRLQIEEQNGAPYNLMLTEAASQRLDLPFASLESIADRIDQALEHSLSAE
jgi:hypothetical protein